jgi:hypothetical protein
MLSVRLLLKDIGQYIFRSIAKCYYDNNQKRKSYGKKIIIMEYQTKSTAGQFERLEQIEFQASPPRKRRLKLQQRNLQVRAGGVRWLLMVGMAELEIRTPCHLLATRSRLVIANTSFKCWKPITAQE